MRERDIVEHRGPGVFGLSGAQRSESLASLQLRHRPGACRLDRLDLSHELGQRVDERVHDAGIQCFSRVLLEHRDCGFSADRRVVGPVGRERVEVVGDADHSGAKWNFISLEAGRVSATIPSFVMAQNKRGDRVGKRNGTDDRRSHLRVDADLLKLLWAERARLREDVLRDRELADVVQQGRGLDGLGLGFRHAHRARKASGVCLHPLDVVGRRLVFGVDSQDERFDRRQVQLGHLPRVRAFVLDPTQVPPVDKTHGGGRRRHEPQHGHRKDSRRQRH